MNIGIFNVILSCYYLLVAIFKGLIINDNGSLIGKTSIIMSIY